MAMQAEAALGLMSQEMAASGSDAVAGLKRLALEARWSAAGSLRELSSERYGGSKRGGADASAYWLLGRAELARGKADKAAEALTKVSQLMERSAVELGSSALLHSRVSPER